MSHFELLLFVSCNNRQGDYYRYWAEVVTGDTRVRLAEKCRDAYEEGLLLAKEKVRVIILNHIATCTAQAVHIVAC